MNGLLLASESQSKDIKFDPKKMSNAQVKTSEQEEDFFIELFTQILDDTSQTSSKEFLIAKMLNLPSDTEQKAQVKASFSDEKLFTDHQIDKVSIESLIEVASILKNDPSQIVSFTTDSQKLQTSLLDLQVQKSFQEASTIKDLLKIAQDNGIEVKNFEFFKEEAALDKEAKEMIQKVKSEDIFKLMESSTSSSHHNTNATKEILQSSPVNSEKTGLLQNILNTQTLNTQTLNTQTKSDQQTVPAKTSITDTKTSQIHTASVSVADIKKPDTLHNHIISSKETPKHPKETLPEFVQQSFPDNRQSQKNTSSVLQSQQSTNINNSSLSHQKLTPDQQIPNIPQTTIAESQTTKTVKPTNTPGTQTQITTQEHTIISSQIVSDKQDRTDKRKREDNIRHTHNSKLQSQPKPTTSVENTSSLKTEIKTVSEIPTPKTEQLTKISSAQVSTPVNSAPHAVSTVTSDTISVKTENPLQIQNPLQKESGTIETSSHQTIDENTVSSDKHNLMHETKNNPLNNHKTEQQDIKKTFTTFAQDFKEQVENYKPPLMKIKMQLNPKNLGEVDVTLINRGNNLQVNINSNPTTIAIFTQNQTEFKNALVNMGFSGLQMQFGENKEGNRGQQHKPGSKSALPFEENQSETDGFELIVPRYI